jgi:hypothetical protein
VRAASGARFELAAVGLPELARGAILQALKPAANTATSTIPVTGLRIAGVGAHHSTTAAATTANTPYAMAGTRLVARAHAQGRRRRPHGYSRVDAGAHLPSALLLGALGRSQRRAHQVYALERRVTR